MPRGKKNPGAQQDTRKSGGGETGGIGPQKRGSARKGMNDTMRGNPAGGKRSGGTRKR